MSTPNKPTSPYNPTEHSHFTAPSVKDDDGHAIMDEPIDIAFVDGKRVWFVGAYPYEGVSGIQKISEYDDTGSAMMAIDIDLCRFWDSAEADAIERGIEADERLLRFAR